MDASCKKRYYCNTDAYTDELQNVFKNYVVNNK